MAVTVQGYAGSKYEAEDLRILEDVGNRVGVVGALSDFWRTYDTFDKNVNSEKYGTEIDWFNKTSNLGGIVHGLGRVSEKLEEHADALRSAGMMKPDRYIDRLYALSKQYEKMGKLLDKVFDRKHNYSFVIDLEQPLDSLNEALRSIRESSHTPIMGSDHANEDAIQKLMVLEMAMDKIAKRKDFAAAARSGKVRRTDKQSL